MHNEVEQTKSAQYMNPLLAGILLGLVLLATFVITGHGLGATGFTTRLTAWVGMHIAPVATNANDYLGGMVEEGKPLNAWITWQVTGVAIGALLSAFLAKRIHIQLDGKKFLGGSKRSITALFGGILAGFGARVAAGCTSGLGLSGAAVLSLAGFTFLGAFFAVGLLTSRFLKEEK
ncbi:YeeE/YedE thiosulfate transporter family protein [Polynucleobacter sp. AP-RePozz3-80-G7]|uniref:YeeE/YedE thiosulfate transporter family protein n=1 Tax=Polynucleobacter sp. AP-RePozz3-80-G7 TaxID=2689105 RepID=UPI001C0CC280|nr:YeeE/YedE thiosulfate transporter family protein [Polynucleobacter sp. AP-RePozz3-80-G7]MBU3639050.1 YeeE/YedE family protein [Polynucleobacter sp. AP-RePozz3-80-G7]